jgi:hypothetical protein
MTSTPVTRPEPLLHHAPFAGTLIDGDGLVPLVVRFDRTAITSDGRLVAIDRPSEWIDGMFRSWYALDLATLSVDQMQCACQLIESILGIKKGRLSADSLQPAMEVAAACVAGTLQQLRQNLALWPDANP